MRECTSRRKFRNWLAKAHGRCSMTMVTESEVYARCQWHTVSYNRSCIFICVQFTYWFSIIVEKNCSGCFCNLISIIESRWNAHKSTFVASIPFIRYALDDKNPKILYGRRESRWECFHLSLWRCLSSQPCDSPPARFSFSLPLTAFTLDRSLPLPLGESCSSDLALAATFLLSRLRSFPPCSLEDPLALVVISSIHLRSCVTTRNFSYTLPDFIRMCDTFFVDLYKYITELLKRFSRKAEWFWWFNAND